MESPINCFDCKNQQCLIKSCDESWIEHLSRIKNQTVYPKEAFVFRQGEQVEGIFFIQAGKVKVTSTTTQGHEQIVRLASDGHILGHRGYGNEAYPINAITMEPSRICFVDNDTLYQAFMENPSFTFELMMFYSRELRKTEQIKKYLTQMNNEEKVAFSLIYILERFGFEDPEKGTIPSCVSRMDMAKIIGTNNEQVSRAITQLREKGIITTYRRQIAILEHQNLKNLIRPYYSLREPA